MRIIAPAQTQPFLVMFKSDADEVQTGAILAAINEEAEFPGGITGFFLDWVLQDC